MKLSEMIDVMTAMKTMYGDLEVLENEFYPVATIVAEIVSARQAAEWGCTEGEIVAQIVAAC